MSVDVNHAIDGFWERMHFAPLSDPMTATRIAEAERRMAMECQAPRIDVYGNLWENPFALAEEPKTEDLLYELDGGSEKFMERMKRVRKVTVECEDGKTYEGIMKRQEINPYCCREMVAEVAVLDEVRGMFGIKKVIFANPTTKVVWLDGTETTVCCQDNVQIVKKKVKKVVDGEKVTVERNRKRYLKSDTYSKEVGLAMCIAKKWAGNDGRYNKIFKEFIKEDAE